MDLNFLQESVTITEARKPNRSRSLLFPLFRAILDEGIDIARANGLMVYLFEGWRSPVRQDYLFTQGRTRSGAIVTGARAWRSSHQFGFAGDLVFDGSEKPGVQWSWDGDYIGSRLDDYKRLGEIMESVGLKRLRNASGRLIEMPHFQLAVEADIKDIDKHVKKFGMLSLWDRLEQMLLSGR